MRHIIYIYGIIGITCHGISAVEQRVDGCVDGRADSDAKDGADHRRAVVGPERWRGDGAVPGPWRRHHRAMRPAVVKMAP